MSFDDSLLDGINSTALSISSEALTDKLLVSECKSSFKLRSVDSGWSPKGSVISNKSLSFLVFSSVWEESNFLRFFFGGDFGNMSSFLSSFVPWSFSLLNVFDLWINKIFNQVDSLVRKKKFERSTKQHALQLLFFVLIQIAFLCVYFFCLMSDSGFFPPPLARLFPANSDFFYETLEKEQTLSIFSNTKTSLLLRWFNLLWCSK